jgi:hypothetical protein
MKLTVQNIAKMAHENNRIYCEMLEDMSQPSWEAAPDWQKESAVAGVEMIIANPDTTPEQSHLGWLAQKEADGWKHGLVKDVEKKEHPCFVSYDKLPTEQRAKDLIFGTVVRLYLKVNEELIKENTYAKP